MTKEQRDEIVNKIKNISNEEVKAIIVKSCEGTGLTYEEFISTDWEDFFTNFESYRT